MDENFIHESRGWKRRKCLSRQKFPAVQYTIYYYVTITDWIESSWESLWQFGVRVKEGVKVCCYYQQVAELRGDSVRWRSCREWLGYMYLHVVRCSFTYYLLFFHRNPKKVQPTKGTDQLILYWPWCMMSVCDRFCCHWGESEVAPPIHGSWGNTQGKCN